MKFFHRLYCNPWVILAFVFVILPSCLYVFFIHDSVQQVLQFRGFVETQGKEPILLNTNLAPSTDQELKDLEKIKKTQFTRIKKIDTRESLLLFNNLVADAIALQAHRYGLQVISVDLENPLIAGNYVPRNDLALDALHSMPNLQWNEIEDPLAVPLLKLPSIDLYITVSGKYSQLFSFLESLSEFPTQVLTSGIQMVDGIDGHFRIYIRGFYYDGNSIEHIAQAETQLDSEESPFQ